MDGSCRKMDIDSTKAVIALQVVALHNVISFGVRGTKMPLKTNVIHRRMLYAQTAWTPYAGCALLSRVLPI